MPIPFNAVAIGELLWDIFPDQRRLGGAPANSAIHLAQLSGKSGNVSLATAVGNDADGNEARQLIDNTNVSTRLIANADEPTGTVCVTLDEHGSPNYEIAADVAWDHIPWETQLQQSAGQADVVFFGTLAQRCDQSRRTIQKFLNATSDRCIRILDINLRPTMRDATVYEQSLQLATALKLSAEELPVLAELFTFTGTVEQQLRQLKDRFELDTVAYTRGENGAVLMHHAQTGRSGGHPTTIVDTVGAGDAFTAALALGLLRTDPVDAIVDNACKIAAFVCSQHGATPLIATDIVDL